MKRCTLSSRLLRRPLFSLLRIFSLSAVLSILAPFVCARPQRPLEPLGQSIAEAARSARQQKVNSTKHPSVITNDDIASHFQSTAAPKTGPEIESETLIQEKLGCRNPAEGERLKLELQNAQDELSRIHSELLYQPTVISEGDLDMRNFNADSSGIYVGSPPLANTQPPIAARVALVSVKEKVESLTQALQIACASTQEAETLKKLDLMEQRLSWLQREFVLNQNAYYSQTNYPQDAAGKARLDAEQLQIESLRSEIQRFKDELPSLKTD